MKGLGCVVLTITFYTTITWAQPVYPLYAIDSVSHTCKTCQPTTAEDATVIATNFSYIHGNYANSTLAMFHQINPAFRPVNYINSHSAPASEVEPTAGGRLGVAYYLIGSLTKALASSDDELSLQLAKKMLPPKASTTAGNVSTKDRYVTFLRIGDELVRINEVKNQSDLVEVKVGRAFDGTSAKAHAAGEAVLAPLYKGSNHPGAGDLTFCLDPAGSFGVERLVNHTLTVVSQGYNGSWLDCFSLGLLKAADAFGHPIKDYWNFNLNQPYTKETMLQAQKQRLTRLFDEVKADIGHYPTILANNIGHTYLPENGNGREFLIANDSEHFRPLDGYSLESFAGFETSTNSSTSCNIKYLEVIWQPEDKWLNNVQTIMYAAQANLAVLPMIASAGCQSPALEVSPLRDQFETYAYASFLLGVEDPNGSIRLGIPAFYRHGEERYAFVHPRYFYRIGRPRRTVAPSDVTSYKLASPHTTYSRPFSGGLVLVNPANATDHNVMLNASYLNPDTKQKITQLDVAARSGYILLSSDELLD